MVDWQCKALSECVNADRGARKELVSGVMGVGGREWHWMPLREGC